MKHLKELIKRFPLLIAALLVSLLSVYNDYSRQPENQTQIYKGKDGESFINGSVNNKNFEGENFDDENIDGSLIEIIKVIDGDSLRLRIANEAPVDVRLYGIDAPEFKQTYGRESQIFLYDLMSRNRIESLEIIDVDRYDRLVVLLYLENGISVQEELLASGMAWYYGRFCKIKSICAEWDDLEKNARSEGLGLWADDFAQAPWNWR